MLWKTRVFEKIGSIYRSSNIHIANIYRGLDHVYSRLAKFREIFLSSSGDMNAGIFTYESFHTKLTKILGISQGDPSKFFEIFTSCWYH